MKSFSINPIRSLCETPIFELIMTLHFKHFLFFLGLILFSFGSFAQFKIIGIVKDKQSDEPIPFISASFKKSQKGSLTDTAGRFEIISNNFNPNDTLQISGVGYKNVLIPYRLIKDSAVFTIKLEVQPPASEAVVKSKYNRALWFWKRIMKYKPLHEKSHWDNYSYEIYNKLEVDLNNVNKQKLGKNVLLKPLNFVLDYVDSTSEDKPFLPVYLTETLSDYYFQKSPHKIREIIKAAKTNGIDNESVVKQLGGLYQNIDVYANFIPVFNLQFVSPFNDNGSNYYNFKLLDTQYLNKKRLVHLRFTPKHKGENVFEGDCWVHDTSFAIQKITLRPAVDANINFIGGLSIIQEFKLIDDTTWFLYKDKMVADITPLGGKNLSLKGRKTATYKNVVLNDANTHKQLETNKLAEQIDLKPNVGNLSDSFWNANRHEDLNKSEKTVYILLDTLEKNPTFKRYRNAVRFITTGTKDIGNIRIGPYYYWISGNNWEGTRVRFDLATNRGFDKHWYLNGYLAYGFKDQKFKGRAEIKYQISKEPWAYISGSYRNDLDNGQVYYDQLGTDNVFATLFRRPNIPFKFQKVEEKKFDYYQETNKGIHFGIGASSKEYEALQNLPGKDFFPSKDNTTPLNSFEGYARLKFSYLERTIEDNFTRVSFGSDYPIVDLKYTHGFKGVLQSGYTYDRIDCSISDYVKVPPYGYIYYNFFGGKINGALPYQMLEIVPGNELYYYNRYAFNLMKRFEFITDEFAGFNLEHNIGNGLFRFIPLTRKWKFRQFWTAKGITGTLSNENQQLNVDNISTAYRPYRSLGGKTYLEIGTGVDNIFKLFRIDFVWRVAPNPVPEDQVARFGVFGSFRITF